MARHVVARLFRDPYDVAERFDDVDPGWAIAGRELGGPDRFVEIRGEEHVGARRGVIAGD
jgi:hypothetical protein